MSSFCTNIILLIKFKAKLVGEKAAQSTFVQKGVVCNMLMKLTPGADAINISGLLV